MKKNKIHLTILISAIFLSFQILNIKAQVTIGSGLPPEKGALLDIKEKKADLDAGNLETAISGGLLMPRVHLLDTKSLAPLIDSSFILNNVNEYTRLKQTHTGLMVYNLTISTSKNLSQGLYKWDGTAWNMIVDEKSLANAMEQLKNLVHPQPAAFMLNNNITNFLSGVRLGEGQAVNMIQLVNTTPDYIQLSADGTKITFAPGFYVVQFTYEAMHNANCDLSSYFVDFPNDAYPSSGARIHSNSSHDTYAYSNHGGTLSAPCLLTKSLQWNISLGRGQAGNCSGTGMTLLGKSTFLYIVRYSY
ncbi:hypothetical protein JGH11_11860 [Dysgonomonas sp. Marseille-P4677]|uniref:hypothetical protein n=1 Tax=Dysgonomonas sp. Marseille-P4677 TaxID=2364790 RepID=UPI00191135FB|nr:hypothetical protein [Dysgonomonas sp. Marseille-P4677]MBK5721566.1 hypothetical protein [Dysgonomonas sp. Marseille-P4677]